MISTFESLDSLAAAAPVVGPSIHSVCFSQPTPQRDWLPILQRAAFAGLASPQWAQKWSGGARMVTSWDEAQSSRLLQPDPEKHRLYSAHMLTSIIAVLPWLPCLLDVTGARLNVGPGFCHFQLPGETETHPIPELLPLTWFLPWVTLEDAINCQ